jgi:sulfite reductase (ferredoxin)
MYRIPSTLNGDLDYTESLIEKYKAGEITAGELKANRVPMGIYEQRKNHHHMLRIRCTGGLITPKQLAKVAFVGHQVSASHLHITTRQEIQIHNVDILDAVPALRKLEAVGLSSAGGGGNTVRNMMVNDRSGLTDREAFDVYPYVEELTSRLIAERDSFTMPRKYKVAMDYNIEDARYSYVADFGLQAVVKDGKRGFRVFIAGSTAPNPHVGWKVFDFLPEIDLLRAAKALKNWFNKYGNRRNRHKARMRYVFYRYGEEEARQMYLDEFNALKKDGPLDFYAPATVMAPEHHDPAFEPAKVHPGFATWKRRYAHKAKDGLWYAYIAIPHGNGSPEFFAQIADYLANYGDDVIRFTKREQIQVRNISEAYLPNIYNFFRKIGVYDIDYPTVVTSLTSCTGADTCRLGICMPKGAIDAITRRLLASDLDLDAIPDFELKMNGCTNICANATWADLGFSGRVGRVGDDPFPAYTVWLPVNGHNEIDQAQGWIAAKYVPAFVEDYLRDVIAQKENYDSYYVYVRERGSEIVRDLLENKYKKVAAFSENPDVFYDYNDDEKFSLIKYGQAECSAGLFDIIDIDQDTIREKRKELATTGDTAAQEKILSDIVFSEARMLLVTRGLDPRTDDDVYNGFLTEFIDAGIVPAKYKVLIDVRRAGGSLLAYREQIEELADLLNNLYKSMDDSLQFHVPSEVQKSGSPEVQKAEDGSSEVQKTEGRSPEVHKTEEESSEEQKVDVFKDFRGVACPMNFVKTKIALTPMQSGQILQILLDDGQPIQNVPGSVKNEGHTVLSTEKVDNYWKVTIKKK